MGILKTWNKLKRQKWSGISFPKMIGLHHFLWFLGPSEKNYLSQFFLITLYPYLTHCSGLNSWEPQHNCRKTFDLKCLLDKYSFLSFLHSTKILIAANQIMKIIKQKTVNIRVHLYTRTSSCTDHGWSKQNIDASLWSDDDAYCTRVTFVYLQERGAVYRV